MLITLQDRPFEFWRFTFWALIAIGLLSGCCAHVKNQLRNASPQDAAGLIEKHLDYCSKKLRLGMRREEALSFLPKPHNTNTENVCVWIIGYTEYAKLRGRFDWQRLQSTKGGYFLVFVEGKLATPLCANAAFNPWEALQSYAKLNIERAQEILGPKP